MGRFFCVESPFVQHCSIEEADRLPDGVRSRVRLRPELMNSWGGAHGGLIVTVLDASMSVAARYAVSDDGQQDVATIDLSVTYIGQAKAEIVCEARVVSRRGSTICAEAMACNESGDLVARAIATLRVLAGRK